MLSSAVLFVCGLLFFCFVLMLMFFWEGRVAFFFFKKFLQECHQSVKLIRLISQQVKF